MAKSVKNYCVYVLRLATGKHFYIGATKDLANRLHEHATRTILEYGSSFPTKTYGFSGRPEDILACYPCNSLAEAYALERNLAQKYSLLCPDTAIFGGGIHFNTPHPFFPEESQFYLLYDCQYQSSIPTEC